MTENTNTSTDDSKIFCVQNDSDMNDEKDKRPEETLSDALNKIRNRFTPVFVTIFTLAAAVCILLLLGLFIGFKTYLLIVISVCLSLLMILLVMRGVIHFTSLQERGKVLPYSGFNIRAPVTARQRRRDKDGM